MVDIFDTAQERSVDQDVEPIKRRQCAGPPMRYGMPRDLDHDYDKQFLFLPTMHKSVEDSQTAITSFFVRRSVYFAFFGKELVVDMSGIPSESAETDRFAYADTTGPDVQEIMKTQVRQLAQEESEKKRTIASLAEEIREQREKLATLVAQTNEFESGIRQTARERRSKRIISRNRRQGWPTLVAKEKGLLEKLETLTSMEQAQTQGLERLGEVMQEQQDRLDQLVLEEQEKNRERLAHESLSRVTEEVGGSQAGQLRA